MSKFSVPPPIALAAQRMARESEPGERIQWGFPLEVLGECVIDGTQHSGTWKMERAFTFLVKADRGVKVIQSTLHLVEEDIRKGGFLFHEGNDCDHPVQCGDPCGWCGALDALVDLVALAMSGDVQKTLESMTRASQLVKDQRG